MDIRHTLEGEMAIVYVNGVRGTLNVADVNALAEHVRGAKKYVETGSYLGASAHIAALSSSAIVYAHDIWVTDWSDLSNASVPPPECADYFYEFYKGVKRNKLENRIIPIRGKSAYTLGIHDDNTIDVAFIDGDHSYEGCLADLVAVWPKMIHGGTILVHDSNMDGVSRAVMKFAIDNNIVNDIQRIVNSAGMLRFKKI
jgi:predicted O-methyltransferase YrrM